MRRSTCRNRAGMDRQLRTDHMAVDPGARARRTWPHLSARVLSKFTIPVLEMGRVGPSISIIQREDSGLAPVMRMSHEMLDVVRFRTVKVDDLGT